ncbi:hypothetical protein CTZ23_15295 [Acinetobacter indicus]|nr:hypothetical protein CTZ23_15295 [Acinetobacter indicus]
MNNDPDFARHRIQDVGTRTGHIKYNREALLHKDFKDRAFLSCLNLSDNLGVRSAELRKLI